MSPSFQSLRLRRLIEERLGTYSGSEVFVSGREDEKNLLIAVSQVLRQVQLWTREGDGSSDSEIEAKSAAQWEFSGEFDLSSEECRCLCKIVCDVMVLLDVESEHLRHVTGNLLLAISDLLSVSESSWQVFIHLLFIFAQFSLSNLSARPSASGPDEPRCELQSHILHIKPRLRNSGWFTVAEITRVLRFLWKNFTHENGDDRIQGYLNSLNSFLEKIPVNLFDEIYGGQNGCDEKSYVSHSLPFQCSQEPKLLFLGYLVQLLCSVIGKCVEAQSGSSDKHPALSTISNLVPKLFYWCLNGLDEQSNGCISVYFHHKLLMLLIRLSIPDNSPCTFNSRLQLFNRYFRNFLWDSVDDVKLFGTNNLEGSPFASTVPDMRMHHLSIPHIQRLATYLFLNCSFSLISLQGQSDEPCNCAILDSTWNHNKTLKDLSQWVSRNVATDLLDNKVYLDKCTEFASSLLKLYIQEDDLLFKLLLQMLKLRLDASEELRISCIDEDLLRHMSNVFNPISIFHILLAEIHYDHQVFLDYLISKDTGISCARYLLRCLRLVCGKFRAFLEFSRSYGEEEPLSKRRKISIQGTDEVENLSSLLSPEKHFESDHMKVYDNQKMRGRPFEEAERCLFSLKDSLESLTQKNLFPYNPKALIKRLTEFQELCYKQRKCNF